MVRSSYIPKEGDIAWLDLDPQAGHEQRGRRPVFVISPIEYNRIGLMIACPITNQAKGYPFEVSLDKHGLATTGAVLSDHIRSFDWKARNAELKEKGKDSLVIEVKKKLSILIGLDD